MQTSFILHADHQKIFSLHRPWMGLIIASVTGITKLGQKEAVLTGQQCYGQALDLEEDLVWFSGGWTGWSKGSRRYFGVFPELLLLRSVSRSKLLGFQGGIACLGTLVRGLHTLRWESFVA